MFVVGLNRLKIIYPNLLYQMWRADHNKVTFDISMHNKEHIHAKQIGPEIKNVIESINPSFKVENGRIISDDMWSF
jgi:hypothetical protein